MNPPDSPDLSEAIFGTLAILAIFACVVVWKAIAMRWIGRQPVLPYQPRRPVPWRAIDVVLLVSMYILAPAVVMRVACLWFDLPREALSQTADAAPLNADHPLSRALLEGHGAWTILLCLVSAVVVAPITEELFFRLVLQGWLESLEQRLRRRIPGLRRIVAGFMPVMTVAFLFAAMHIRTPAPRADLPVVVLALSIYSVSSLLTVIASVCWLGFAARGTLADFGIVPSKLAEDVRIGLLAFLAVTVPVYAVMIDVKELLPNIAVADPIPILFLAMALGILYYRTHRIVPSLALHMTFNAVGVLMALAASK
jgi:membrane protease YdiL (CAAX protease family)